MLDNKNRANSKNQSSGEVDSGVWTSYLNVTMSNLSPAVLQNVGPWSPALSNPAPIYE